MNREISFLIDNKWRKREEDTHLFDGIQTAQSVE
jgi:hypothetical protein